jgi:hypothetical protein
VLLENVRPVGYHAWVDDDVVALFVLGTPATLQLASARTGEATLITSDIGRSLQKIPGRRAISFVHRTLVNDTLRWLIRELAADTRTIRTIAHAPTETADGRVTSADFHAWTPSGALVTSIGNRIVVWDGGAGSWYDAAVLDGLAVTRLAISPRGDRIAFVAQAPARIP